MWMGRKKVKLKKEMTVGGVSCLFLGNVGFGTY